MLEQCGHSFIVGYDPDERKIRSARDRCSSLIPYAYSSESLPDRGFDTVFSSFVFHETSPGYRSEIGMLLSSGGNAIILDYDMKHMGLEEFCRLFSLEREVEEFLRMGLHRAYELHTASGLEHCAIQGRDAGFCEAESRKLYGKYFLWVGMKSGVIPQ